MQRRSIQVLSLAVAFILFVACSAGGPAAVHQAPPQTNAPQAEASPHGRAQPQSPLGTSSEEEEQQQLPVYTYEVVKSWPHDQEAYTQGLVFRDKALFESTGQYGASSLRKVELQTGKVIKKVDVPANHFAEGMTIFRDKVFQLTWVSGKCFVYDFPSFRLQGEFAYSGEGWGLTHDDRSLIMSDGTDRIRFLDPMSFRVEKTIGVRDHKNLPVTQLNELEYVKGEIYANVWKTNRIVRLDPASGKVIGLIDLKGLRPTETKENEENVLNGIAYDAANDRLFVTGKRWPKVFEIRLKRK